MRKCVVMISIVCYEGENESVCWERNDCYEVIVRGYLLFLVLYFGKSMVLELEENCFRIN